MSTFSALCSSLPVQTCYSQRQNSIKTHWKNLNMRKNPSNYANVDLQKINIHPSSSISSVCLNEHQTSPLPKTCFLTYSQIHWEHSEQRLINETDVVMNISYNSVLCVVTPVVCVYFHHGWQKIVTDNVWELCEEKTDVCWKCWVSCRSRYRNSFVWFSTNFFFIYFGDSALNKLQVCNLKLCFICLYWVLRVDLYIVKIWP